MADILPIRAWKYNELLSGNIENQISPLFDVVSEKQRENLYSNPYNSIHLSVPKGQEASSIARTTLNEWKERGVIMQDELPAIYVYYQYFSLPGSNKEYIRKGFIANIKLHDWDENVILRHENTNPIYETEDYQGVKDVLACIQDQNVINICIELLADKQIILADGHHRYEGSLAYMKEKKATNPNHTGNEGYNYHMMYFTNTEADDLRILPTHRVVQGLEGFSEDSLLEKLAEDFTIKPVENTSDVQEIILGKQWAFGLLLRDNAYKIRLKEGKISDINWKFPQEVKELDLTVLHYFVIEKALGVTGKDQRSLQNVIFERNFTECVSKVLKKEANFAVITNDIPIETVKKVCYSGYTMPQKSTYFYPKVICGYIFSSIDDDEFKSPFDSCFSIS